MIEWLDNEDFPDELNIAQNGFSVDVLIYFKSLDEHTIGWFQYSAMRWFFLSNQDYSGIKFKWRYFVDEIDKHSHKTTKK